MALQDEVDAHVRERTREVEPALLVVTVVRVVGGRVDRVVVDQRGPLRVVAVTGDDVAHVVHVGSVRTGRVGVRVDVDEQDALVHVPVVATRVRGRVAARVEVRHLQGVRHLVVLLVGLAAHVVVADGRGPRVALQHVAAVGEGAPLVLVVGVLDLVATGDQEPRRPARSTWRTSACPPSPRRRRR